MDCGSADHPMNTIIRDWMPRQARQADAHFREKYGKPLAEFFDDAKYQLMHLEMFNHGIIHAECLGGDIDLLLNQRVHDRLLPVALRGRRVAASRASWRSWTTSATSELMKVKAKCKLTKFGDIAGAFAPQLHGRKPAPARRAAAKRKPKR